MFTVDSSRRRQQCLRLLSRYMLERPFSKIGARLKLRQLKSYFYGVSQPETKTGIKVFSTTTQVLGSSETARGKS